MTIVWLFSKAGSERGLSLEQPCFAGLMPSWMTGNLTPLYTQSCLELQTARDYPNVNYYVVG